MIANPEPEVGAAIESGQRTNSCTGTHRPKIAFDAFEAERFQRWLFLPEEKVLPRDF